MRDGPEQKLPDDLPSRGSGGVQATVRPTFGEGLVSQVTAPSVSLRLPLPRHLPSASPPALIMGTLGHLTTTHAG